MPVLGGLHNQSILPDVVSGRDTEHRMHPNYLKGRDSDRINAVLAAAGYNFALLLRWLAELLRGLILMLDPVAPQPQTT